MRLLIAVLLLAAASTADGAGTRVVVLANTIDSGTSSGIYQFLEGNGATPVKSDANAFQIIRDAPLIVVLGGQNSPEGVGQIVAGMLSQEEQTSLTKPGARAMFVKEGVFSERQRVFVFAGYSAEDTMLAWAGNKDALSAEFAAQKSVALSAPPAVLVEPKSNMKSISFPVNASNTGGENLSGLQVEAYLNGGIRLETEPATLDLESGQSKKVMVRLNPKNLTDGDIVTVMVGGAEARLMLNVTGYERINKLCNICAASGLL
jgi:hypothetical protein